MHEILSRPFLSFETQINTDNAAGEQRPELIPTLHGLYEKPLSSRRLLQWVGYVLIFLGTV